MIIGVDPGERRVGVAVADEETNFARPFEVIDAQATEPVARIARLVDELGASRVVVGRPVGLSGRAGPAVERQRDFVERLRAQCKAVVVEHDERLTTVLAERGLRAGGAKSRGRKAQRDAVAAQLMLQSYLDAAR